MVRFFHVCCCADATVASSNIKPLAILATIDLRPKSSISAAAAEDASVAAAAANEDVGDEGNARDVSQKSTHDEVTVGSLQFLIVCGIKMDLFVFYI